MDLALDIGNSAVKGALFPDQRGAPAEGVFQLALPPAEATLSDWQHALDEVLATQRPERAGLVSVVPAATSRAAAALRRGWNLDPFRVAPDAPLPFRLAYRSPTTLGADRLAAAAAAWLCHAGPPGRRRSVVALDAGTALTAEAVRAGPGGNGVYEGGAIAPGPVLSARALAGGTAQLPDLPLTDLSAEASLPPAIGTTTEEALRSGLLHGLLDTAAGLLRRFTEALGPPSPVVVTTGGAGAFLHAHLSRTERHDPHLVLRGVHALMRLHAAEA